MNHTLTAASDWVYSHTSAPVAGALAHGTQTGDDHQWHQTQCNNTGPNAFKERVLQWGKLLKVHQPEFGQGDGGENHRAGGAEQQGAEKAGLWQALGKGEYPRRACGQGYTAQRHAGHQRGTQALITEVSRPAARLLYRAQRWLVSVVESWRFSEGLQRSAWRKRYGCCARRCSGTESGRDYWWVYFASVRCSAPVCCSCSSCSSMV